MNIRKLEILRYDTSPFGKKDLRAIAQDKLENCYELARNFYGTKLATPKLEFDVNSTVAGLAHVGQNLIRLNPDFLLYYPKDMIEDTVPHEAAHCLDWRMNGAKRARENNFHGDSWERCCRIVGIEKPEVSRTHNYDCSLIKIKKGGDAFTCKCRDRVWILSTKEQKQNRYCRTCGFRLQPSILEL